MRQAPAEMDRGRRGRNPASVISKMESTSDRPGGHNLLCCCGRPADSRREIGARLEANEAYARSTTVCAYAAPAVPLSGVAVVAASEQTGGEQEQDNKSRRNDELY